MFFVFFLLNLYNQLSFFSPGLEEKKFKKVENFGDKILYIWKYTFDIFKNIDDQKIMIMD